MANVMAVFKCQLWATDKSDFRPFKPLIIFDPYKDAANVAKHALSLTLARDLEWDTLQWKGGTRDLPPIPVPI